MTRGEVLQSDLRIKGSTRESAKDPAIWRTETANSGRRGERPQNGDDDDDETLSEIYYYLPLSSDVVSRIGRKILSCCEKKKKNAIHSERLVSLLTVSISECIYTNIVLKTVILRSILSESIPYSSVIFQYVVDVLCLCVKERKSLGRHTEQVGLCEAL